jgi:Ni/Co efflux regulator RcnB
MRKSFIVPAFALCLAAPAFAQPDERTTTTTVETPNGSSTTTTTESSDGYTKYRKTVTASRSFDAGPFRAPSGYTYSRYRVGDHVPTVLLGSDLDLSDYSTYALVAPPEGLKWIRVGDDALLISRNSGEVIQTDYGLFRG